MTTEMVVAGEQKKIVITPEHLSIIKNTIARGATDAELQLFCWDCKRRGVHPMDRLIHFTKRKGRDGVPTYVPITSIDYMRSRASQSGQYAGSGDAEFVESDGEIVSATVTVKRLLEDGSKADFTATARLREYFPEEEKSAFMWKRMPHTMLGKCAEALALRKGFPQQLDGLYIDEEMQQAAATGTGISEPHRKSETGAAQSGDSADAVVSVVGIDIVKSKPGAKKDWTRYDITADNETVYKTFSESFYQVANDAKTAGRKVHVVAAKGQYGYDLQSIERVSEDETTAPMTADGELPLEPPSKEEALFADLNTELGDLQSKSDVDSWLTTQRSVIDSLSAEKAKNLRYMAGVKRNSLKK